MSKDILSLSIVNTALDLYYSSSYLLLKEHLIDLTITIETVRLTKEFLSWRKQKLMCCFIYCNKATDCLTPDWGQVIIT